MRIVQPRCSFCHETAVYLAAQSLTEGKQVKWRQVCPGHIVDWNHGGDWEAPVYQLSNVTKSYPVKS